MALAPGTRLGVYEVVGSLGAGGMGEVYCARDPRLGRDVAVKVLPAAFAADPERLQRFEQEARAAAALNHPNILAVHDIGQHEGAPFIVSELLDGETLRERLQGEIIYFGAANSSVQRVAASGGTPSPATTLDPATGEVSHHTPVVLPGGRHVLYAAFGKGGEPIGVFAWTLESGERKLIVPGGVNAKYADGRLVFLREQTLFAQSFDPERLDVTGSPAAIADAVQRGGGSLVAIGAFTLAETGILAYQLDTATRSRLTWLDRSGKVIGFLGDEADHADVQLSPDGTRVAVSIVDAARRTSDVWLYELRRGVATRFTTDPADDIAPVWSPDGSRIALASRRSGQLRMYVLPVSGTATEERLVEDQQRNVYAYSWSPDGQYILYQLGNTGSETATNDIWMLPLAGDRMPRAFLETAFQDLRPQFSPDGRWVAYTSNETARFEVYVTPFPGPGGKVRVSIDGGAYPRWGRDGRELFFLRTAGSVMTVVAASIQLQGNGFQPGDVRPLFDVQLGRPPVSGYLGYMYDVSPDGQRFLVNTAVGDEIAASAVSLVINWPAALRQ